MMKQRSLTRIGKCIILTMLLFASSALQAATIATQIESKRMSVGETITLKISVSGGNAVQPVRVPKVPGLEISFIGRGTSIQIINFNRKVSTVFSYSIFAEKKGNYKIPALVFDVDGTKLKSDVISLVVIKGARRSQGVSSQYTLIETEVEVLKERYYVGEPILMRYYLVTSDNSVIFKGFEKSPETKGFIIKEFEESVDDVVVKKEGGEYIKSHLATVVLVPTGDGLFTIGGGVGVVTYEVREGLFPFNRSKSIPFQEKAIEIKPLPARNRPPQFKGDVGQFSMKLDYLDEALEVFQEKRITVTMKGSGNLLSMTKPEIGPVPDGVKILEEEGDSFVSIKNNNLFGEKKFVLTVIPEKSGKILLGPFTFAYFDITSKTYKVVSSQQLSMNVKEGLVKKKGLEFDSENSNKVEFNPLYIAGILFLLTGIIGFVVIWEKRKLLIVTGEAKKKEVEAEEKKPDKEEYNKYLRDMVLYVRKEDGDSFLKTVDKIINYAKDYSDIFMLSSEDIKRMEEIKDRIYGYKFGRIALSKEEMDLIHKEIKEILK